MSKILQNAAATKKRLRQVAEEVAASSSSDFLLEQQKKRKVDNPLVEAAVKTNKKNKNNQNETNKNSSDASKLSDELIENVIYIGHLPVGFYEREMRKFFSQFGEVNRIKLFKSKKTNKSKGYAFVEFTAEDVAKVVSEAMNGYMMHDKVLVCNVVPKSKMHDGMFKLPKRKVIEEVKNESVENLTSEPKIL